MFQCNDIWKKKFLHELQLPIFISLILVYFLYGNLFSIFIDSALKDNTKGTISYNSICVVGETRLLMPILISNSTFKNFLLVHIIYI